MTRDDSHLTEMFSAGVEQAYKETPKGMAHWKGSGPPLTICRQCKHYVADRRHVSAGPDHAAGQLRPGWCRKYKEMVGVRHAPRFFSETPSCKHFEMAERVPLLVDKKWRG